MGKDPLRTRLGWQITAASAALVMAAGIAWATHPEPGRGRTVKMPLVQAYAACTSPNTFTATDGAPPLPACTPPVLNDANCTFGLADMLHGSGKASAVSTSTGDIELKLLAKGLLCEGYRLCGALSFRATTDRCQSGPSCTVIDITDWIADTPTGCCVVTNGICRLKTTVNAIRFDTIRQGDRAGVELFGCGLKRMDGPNPPSALSFRCGPVAGPAGP